MSELHSNGFVFIVDDDVSFRALAQKLLQFRDYGVIFGEGGQDLTGLWDGEDIRLAIIDWTAKDFSIEWLEQLLEQFEQLPVMFVGDSRFDEKIFEELRRIARNSLFVKKPVTAEVFVQQVELLAPQVAVPAEGQEGIANLFGATEDETAASTLKQLIRLRSRLEVKNALKVAQMAYLDELQVDWKNLSSTVSLLKNAHNDNPGKSRTHVKTRGSGVDREGVARAAALHDAISSVHKIKGTAGSLNLPQISDIAASLERCLIAVNIRTSDEDVLWKEISQFLSDGEQSVKTALISREQISIEPAALIKVLLVGNGLEQYASQITGCSVQVASDFKTAMNKARRWDFDAAVIDSKIADNKELFELTNELRTTALHQLPLALIDPNGKLSASEQLFAGFSRCLPEIRNENDLVELVAHLLIDGRSHKQRILFIDDDHVLCGFISVVLTGQGFDVKTLHNPVQAVSTVNSFKPDLVILDLVMPGMSGYEACKAIREDSEFRTVPILFLTGNTSSETRSSAFVAGADDFLAKPVLMEELLTRVAGQLNRAAQHTGRMIRDHWTGLQTEDAFIGAAEQLIQNAKDEKRSLRLSVVSLHELDAIRLRKGIAEAKAVVSDLGTAISRRFRAADLRGLIGDRHFAILWQDTSADAVNGALSELTGEFSEKHSVKSDDEYLRLGSGTSEMHQGSDQLDSLLKDALRKALPVASRVKD